MRRGHKGRHFLVTHLNELYLVFGSLQRPENPVDAVARITEDTAHAPFVEPVDKEIANSLAHCAHAFQSEDGDWLRIFFCRNNRRHCPEFRTASTVPRRNFVSGACGAVHLPRTFSSAFALFASKRGIATDA
jgi:hypothetical protein